jgi:hypothetical protein
MIALLHETMDKYDLRINKDKFTAQDALVAINVLSYLLSGTPMGLYSMFCMIMH